MNDPGDIKSQKYIKCIEQNSNVVVMPLSCTLLWHFLNIKLNIEIIFIIF